MKISVSNEIYKIFPKYINGILIITDLNNHTSSKDPYGLLKQVTKHIKLSDNISKWNKYLEKAGIDHKKYPSSIETMSKKKNISSINPIVDLYNFISLREMVPMGGYDLSKVTKDLEIRHSKEGDSFTPLLSNESYATNTGDIVFVEDKTVLCDKWVWKQNDYHKVTKETKNLVIRIEGLGQSKEKIDDIMNELSKLITKYCGGKAKKFILDDTNKTIKLDNINIIKRTKQETQIYELLNRGTVDVIKRDELQDKLISGKKLKIKLGIDPTGSKLHLGHMVVVKKLAEFQKLGHHIQLLFGNFTGQIGDPKAKEVRKMVTQKDLEKNAETYQLQVSKILDINNIEIVWNADWLSKLNFSDIVNLSSQFTVSQMLERDMFQERIKKKSPIYVHEFMYPLMQGYDSVALESDVELGGTDQTFNLLAGRTLQKAYFKVPQSIITVPILEGLDGHIKMGKSENNFVGVTETPDEQYGKIMSIPDNLILRYFELTTNISLKELDRIRKDLLEGLNPRDAKMRLAREIISIYHSETEAKNAEINFKNIFQKKKTPDKIDIYKTKKDENILDIMSNTFIDSKAEARRLIKQGAVTLNGNLVKNINYDLKEEGILKIGKRRFIKITF